VVVGAHRLMIELVLLAALAAVALRVMVEVVLQHSQHPQVVA
jgi:hypothetical protein